MISSPYCAISALQMFLSLKRRNVNSSQNKNSGTNLPFSSLLTPNILAKQQQQQQQVEEPRRYLKPTFHAAYRAFLNV